MVVANNEIDGNKKYTSNAGNIDGHVHTAVQCGVHCPIEGIRGFMRKLLDAAIWQVPMPNCLGSHHG
jgi:hypothetical protein